MRVQTILMDMEFDKTVNDQMDNVVATNSATKKHIVEIEQCICTVKECSRAVVTTLPFDYLTKMIVVNLVYLAVMWINTFLAKNGVSNKFPP